MQTGKETPRSFHKRWSEGRRASTPGLRKSVSQPRADSKTTRRTSGLSGRGRARNSAYDASSEETACHTGYPASANQPGGRFRNRCNSSSPARTSRGEGRSPNDATDSDTRPTSAGRARRRASAVGARSDWEERPASDRAASRATYRPSRRSGPRRRAMAKIARDGTTTRRNATAKASVSPKRTSLRSRRCDRRLYAKNQWEFRCSPVQRTSSRSSCDTKRRKTPPRARRARPARAEIHETSPARTPSTASVPTSPASVAGMREKGCSETRAPEGDRRRWWAKTEAARATRRAPRIPEKAPRLPIAKRPRSVHLPSQERRNVENVLARVAHVDEVHAVALIFRDRRLGSRAHALSLGRRPRAARRDGQRHFAARGESRRRVE